MALEQPFTHWPFSSASNGRPGQQNSQRNFDRFKRYDTNESPFMEISPIPAGREFGTFPRDDRQPKNVARKELTHNLNIRASRGFLAPEELTPENQFLPILPENEEITRDNPLHEPAFQQDTHLHQVHPDPDTTREPLRGLSLMDRYRNSNQDTGPIRRTNSLLQFEQFIGQVGEPTNQRQQNPPHHVPSPQQRQRQPPAMTEQQSFKRMGHQQQQQAYPLQNGGSRRQPNGGLIGSQQYSSGRRQANGSLNVNQRNGVTHLNGIQQPRAVPTLIPSYPTTAQPIHHQPLDNLPYPPRKPRKRREKGKEKNILCCGIGLVLTGFFVLSGFIAGFVAITILNNAWPNSGLLLAGVVFGLLIAIVGFIFACHRCYSIEEYDDTPALVGNVQPVWSHSLQRSTLDRPANLEAIPMTDLPLVGEDYNEQPLEPDVHVIDGNLGETLPNGSSPVANGVPTPLAFASPFSTTANDYGMY